MPMHRLLQLLLLASATCLPASAQDVILGAGGRLVRCDRSGKVQWELPWGGIHDLHQLPNGNLMVQRGGAEVVEVVPHTGRVVWSYNSGATQTEYEGRVEVHAFQPLPNGRVMIAESGSARIIEVNRLGQIQSTTPFKVDNPHPHRDTRLVRKLESGNYLVCHEGDGAVRELEPETGRIVWEFKVPMFGLDPAPGHGPTAMGNSVFGALRLANGNTLIATGNGHRVLEVTPAGEIVWSLKPGDLPGIDLGWITTLQVLDSGHYAIGNCHAGKDQPILLVLDPATKQLAWTLNAHAAFGNNVSNSLVLGVGAEADLLDRARRLHAEVVTLDTHKDISSNLATAEIPEEVSKREEWSLRNDPRRWGRSQVDFPKMHAGGLDVAFFIVYVGQGGLDDEGFARADEIARTKFEAILRMCERFPDDIELARTADDVERIAAAGKLVACIGIENGYAMGQDISKIAEFHALGARYMSLTHNRHSQLGDSHTPEKPLHGGITDLGREAVRELNRVGILVDVSHASKTTMMQATALSKAPVIASHSGVDEIRVHGRNLDDEQLRALAANGGVIQCVAFSSYVTDTGARDDAVRAARSELGLSSRRGAGAADTSEDAQQKRRMLRERVKAIEAEFPPSDVSDFADHIDHAVKIAGIDHVAISSDFDGGGGLVGWNSAAETFNVTMELCRRGYSDEDVAKLWSGNTLRIWRQVEAIAARLQAEDK